jgi:hypothetical protein
MKKICAILILSLSFILNANSLDEIDSMIDSNRVTTLPEIAYNLSAKGSIHHSKGEYVEAIRLYKNSLMLRERLGLEKTKAYATVLFLLSIAEYKSSKSCNSLLTLNKVMAIYKYNGAEDDLRIAEEESNRIYFDHCRYGQ